MAQQGWGQRERIFFFPSSAAGLSYIRTELLCRDTLSALTSSPPGFFSPPRQAQALGNAMGREEESLLSGAAAGPAQPCEVLVVRR